jgi:hypothetical protein
METQWGYQKDVEALQTQLTTAFEFKTFLSTAVKVFDDFTNVYDNCRVYVIPYSIAANLENGFDEVVLKFAVNIGNIIADLITVFQNYGSEPSTAGKALGSAFRYFITPAYRATE